MWRSNLFQTPINDQARSGSPRGFDAGHEASALSAQAAAANDWPACNSHLWPNWLNVSSPVEQQNDKWGLEWKQPATDAASFAERLVPGEVTFEVTETVIESYCVTCVLVQDMFDPASEYFQSLALFLPNQISCEESCARDMIAEMVDNVSFNTGAGCNIGFPADASAVKLFFDFVDQHHGTKATRVKDLSKAGLPAMSRETFMYALVAANVPAITIWASCQARTDDETIQAVLKLSGLAETPVRIGTQTTISLCRIGSAVADVSGVAFADNSASFLTVTEPMFYNLGELQLFSAYGRVSGRCTSVIADSAFARADPSIQDFHIEPALSAALRRDTDLAEFLNKSEPDISKVASVFQSFVGDRLDLLMLESGLSAQVQWIGSSEQVSATLAAPITEWKMPKVSLVLFSLSNLGECIKDACNQAVALTASPSDGSIEYRARLARLLNTVGLSTIESNKWAESRATLTMVNAESPIEPPATDADTDRAKEGQDWITSETLNVYRQECVAGTAGNERPKSLRPKLLQYGRWAMPRLDLIWLNSYLETGRDPTKMHVQRSGKSGAKYSSIALLSAGGAGSSDSNAMTRLDAFTIVWAKATIESNSLPGAALPWIQQNLKTSDPSANTKKRQSGASGKFSRKRRRVISSSPSETSSSEDIPCGSDDEFESLSPTQELH